MNSRLPSLGDGEGGEISSLISTLHEIGQRLEDLTVGEVDTVANSEGHTFVLRHAQEHLRKVNADRQAAVLDALPLHIALLDPNGLIVSVNEAWRIFGRDNALQREYTPLGVSYLQICDDAGIGDSGEASEVAVGLQAVLSGAKKTFSIEYGCHSPPEQRWFRLTAMALSEHRLGGAVVMLADITDIKQKSAALLRFSAAMDATADAIYLVDRNSMRFVHVNDAACRMQGCSREALLETAPADLLETSAVELSRVYDELIASNTVAVPMEILWTRGDDTKVWLELRRHAMRSDGCWIIVTLVRDITQRKETELRIKRLNRVDAMLSGINALIVRVHDRVALFKGACSIAVEAGGFGCAWISTADAGTSSGTVVASQGARSGELAQIRIVTQAMTSGNDYPESRALSERQPLIFNDIAADLTPVARRHELLAHGHRSAAYFPLMLAGQPTAVLSLFANEIGVFDAAETQLLVELTSNLSFALEHIGRADRLHYLAYYDELTGLANRSLFLERVAQYVRIAANEGHQVGLFLIDLERFKNINDSMGEAAGDALLRQVARWLRDHLGGADLIARISADHFAVVLPEVRVGGNLERLFSKKVAAFVNHPFRLNDAVFRIGFKAGIAIFPEAGNNADTLFKHAEAALKKAKVRGERFMYYTHTMTDAVAGKVTLESQLRQALDRGEFVLHYQPKVNLATGLLTSAEALIRWNDPRTGLVAPARFIPILEETGLIHDVGRWALQQAITDHLRWRAAGLAAVRIAVNVSPLQLRNRGFVAEIVAAISVAPDAALGLEIEITESVIMEDVALSIASLKAVREMGVSIAIDDFGTGFSSLSYLSKLPIDTLKIDRSFIIDMTASAEGLSLVSMIINLGHSLNLKVIAEGVETEEQSRLLRLLNCNEMQGFLFSKPIPRDLFETRFLTPVPSQ